MAIALETRRLAKSFHAGSGLCVASAYVLRGVDLVLHTGEAVGLIGPRGCGKSTLLLCLAGLLKPDAGSVRWFGRTDLDFPDRCALYHSTRVDLMRSGSGGASHIHLVDVPAGVTVLDLDAWISARQHEGDAVLIAASDRSALPSDIPILSLTNGRVRRVGDEQARVAERVPALAC